MSDKASRYVETAIFLVGAAALLMLGWILGTPNHTQVWAQQELVRTECVRILVEEDPANLVVAGRACGLTYEDLGY